MLFEVDCGDELQDVTVMIGDRNPGEIAQRGPNLWHYALVRLANEGRVDRGRLLSSAQEATDRWPRRAWYAEFVELLESA